MYNFLNIFFFFSKLFFSWGPGAHLHFGNMVLNDKDFEFEEKEILLKNQDEFLYGNISPDITLGKKYIKDIDRHCHKWDTGFKVLKDAESDKQKALGLGYLAHLAADVIAHNFYLPKELLEGRGLRAFSHLITEIKVDMIMFHDARELVERMLKLDFSKKDKYLKGIISEAFLPFGVNRKIFEYSLKMTKNKHVYNFFRNFTDYEKWALENKGSIKEYHEISYYLIMDVLEHKENSIVVKHDPNGEHHFNILKELRKEYRELKHEKEKHMYYKIPDELLRGK